MDEAFKDMIQDFMFPETANDDILIAMAIGAF
jgi:hypothetical protein